jgi:hypothetical protein
MLGIHVAVTMTVIGGSTMASAVDVAATTISISAAAFSVLLALSGG